MLIKLLTKVFGSRNERTLRRMRKVVNVINAMEPEMEKLSDDELKAKTAEFRARLEKGASVESLIPEAFAVVREASKRVFGMRHFDVQLLGGMVLNDRCIAEMRTGEGKTLTATLPAYLNALTGKGVHIVTVNDYLAKRDSEWMGKVHRFLGLSVGLIVHDLTSDERRAWMARYFASPTTTGGDGQEATEGNAPAQQPTKDSGAPSSFAMDNADFIARAFAMGTGAWVIEPRGVTDSAYTLKGQVGFVAFCRSGGNLIDVGGAVKAYQNSAT